MTGARDPGPWEASEWACSELTDPGQVKAWVALFNASFGKTKDRATWDWKYCRNPHGSAVARVARNARGDLVGAYAYLPRRFRVDGRSTLLMQASDAMTVPEHRGQGIFTSLDNQVCRAVAASGVPLAFAYSGRQSLRGFLSNGWEQVGNVPLWRLCYRSRRALRRKGRLGPLLSLAAPLVDVLKGGRQRARWMLPTGGPDTQPRQLVRLELFDDRAQELFEATVAQTGLVGERDPAWLNWRYIDTPSGRHECFAIENGDRLDGWMVTEWVDGHGYLVDHWARDAETRRFQLLAFVHLGLAHAAEEATVLAAGHDPVVADLTALGFRARPDGLAFRDVFPFIIRRCRDDAPTMASELTRWQLADGDRDAEHMSP